jgi:hypothetical protein
MSLLSAADIAGARSALEVLLTHRYTRQAMVSGVEDEEGNTPKVPAGASDPSIPCRYETVQRMVRTDAGMQLVSIPTLSVSATDTLRVGDEIDAVTDQLGNVLAEGPLRVERVVDDTAGLGAALLPSYELRAAKAAQ